MISYIIHVILNIIQYLEYSNKVKTTRAWNKGLSTVVYKRPLKVIAERRQARVVLTSFEHSKHWIMLRVTWIMQEITWICRRSFIRTIISTVSEIYMGTTSNIPGARELLIKIPYLLICVNFCSHNKLTRFLFVRKCKNSVSEYSQDLKR